MKWLGWFTPHPRPKHWLDFPDLTGQRQGGVQSLLCKGMFTLRWASKWADWPTSIPIYRPSGNNTVHAETINFETLNVQSKAQHAIQMHHCTSMWWIHVVDRGLTLL